MRGIFFGAPSALPTPVRAPTWTGLESITWTGPDGETFELADPRASGVYLRSGVRGFNMPPVKRYADAPAAVAGSLWRGSNVEEREVFLPVTLYNRQDSKAWRAHDDAWWATMDPTRPGTLTVTSAGGTARQLRIRYTGDGDHAFDIDPSLTGWVQYGLYFVAEQPYWQGAPVARAWGVDEGAPLFPAPAADYVVFLSAGSTVATASLSNPGDVPAYVQWTVHGQASKALLGANGRLIQVNGALAAGEDLIVDPRPTAQTAIHSVTGEDWVTGTRIGEADWDGSLVRPGQDVPLSIDLTGTGGISARLVPLHYRAW